MGHIVESAVKTAKNKLEIQKGNGDPKGRTARIESKSFKVPGFGAWGTYDPQELAAYAKIASV